MVRCLLERRCTSGCSACIAGLTGHVKCLVHNRVPVALRPKLSGEARPPARLDTRRRYCHYRVATPLTKVIHGTMAHSETLSALAALAPWHHDLELRGGIRTAVGNQSRYDDPGFANVSVLDPYELAPLLRRIYPSGLAGKNFLDVACNSGGYCFVAKSLGAATTFGFDARDHWIRQAEFVKANWPGDSEGIEFAQCDLFDVDTVRSFDICMFKGIFYHLPDPVHGLQQMADITREVIIVDTATRGDRGDMCLRLNDEGNTHTMSGIYGMAWWPSGPDLIVHILKWLGFEGCREIWWRKGDNPDNKTKVGRCRVIGARSPELLEAFDADKSAPAA